MSETVQGASIAPKPAPSRSSWLNRTVMLGSALLLALTMAAVEAPPVSADGSDAEPAKGSQAALILRMMRDAVGHPFRLGTEGPKYFDCSGLVWSVYKRAGLVGRIGGIRGTVTRYYRWAQRNGKITGRNPRIGDVIIWGKDGRVRHTGIYIGNGRAISALNPRLGVRTHAVGGIGMRVWGYIHTGISR